LKDRQGGREGLTGDLRAWVRDSDELGERVLAQDVRVALLIYIVAIHVDLEGGGEGGGEKRKEARVQKSIHRHNPCHFFPLLPPSLPLPTSLPLSLPTCCVLRWRLVAETARTRHSVLPEKDRCSYWDEVVTRSSSLGIGGREGGREGGRGG